MPDVRAVLQKGQVMTVADTHAVTLVAPGEASTVSVEEDGDRVAVRNVGPGSVVVLTAQQEPACLSRK